MERIIFCMILFSLAVFSQQTSNFRLSKDSAPLSYELQFELKMTNRTNNRKLLLHGKAKIIVDIFKPSINLTMHAYKLIFNENKTQLDFGLKTFTPEKHILVDDHQLLILNFKNYLAPGRYHLSLEYSGEAYDYFYSQQGLFYGKYRNDEGEIEYVAATQFQPNFARRVFPCWDEPALKANFEISIIHSANYTAISNMPVKEVNDTTGIDGEKVTSFVGTPPMSTYSVAFVVSTYKNVIKPPENISLWTSTEFANNSVEIAHESILRAFTLFENYGNIQYSLPKLDIFGIPYFYYGAMGNWGLITVSNEMLLINNTSNARDALKHMLSLRHEIVHQWIGNLVSPNWWTDVWITEGLTTYFESQLFSKALNDSTILDYALIDCHLQASFDFFERELVLGKDTLKDHFTDLVDYSHNRGAALMRMLSGLISEKFFKRGIRTLLKRYNFKTISTEDFWDVMQESLNQSQVPYFDIKEKMEPYISQVGIPLVNVQRNYKTGEIKLTQECIYKNLEINSKWWIPINYATSSSFNFSSTQATLWMNPNETETIIRGIDPNDLVIFNIQGTAPYVVNYDFRSWLKIVDYLKWHHTDIHPQNRANLILDAYWSSVKRKIQRNLYKSLLTYLKHEREFIPWAVGDYIFKFLRDEKKFLSELVTPLLNDNNIENDNIFTRYMKQVALDVKKEYEEFLRQQEEYLKSNPDDREYFE